MKARTWDLLKRLSEVNGIPGFERRVGDLVERELKGFCAIERDNLGSVIAAPRSNAEGPKIMLAGHMDEIGFMVKRVTKEGFVKFTPLGGWWDQVLLAQRVIIETHKGPIRGLIGCKPPHILTPEEAKKVVERKDMYIDIGAKDRDEATKKLGVRPGQPIMPWSPCERLANPDYLLGKAWDDRFGVALMVEALKAFERKQHPNQIYGAGTTQEEVGLRGAQTAVHTVDPDIGLILDVTIAGDVPGMSEDDSELKLGQGVVINLLDGSMIPDQRLRDFIIDVAEQEQIPHQLGLLERGGTDGGRIHIHARGVPSCFLAVATRHIHSHAAIMHAKDFDNALRLVTALIKRLDAKTVARIKKP